MSGKLDGGKTHVSPSSPISNATSDSIWERKLTAAVWTNFRYHGVFCYAGWRIYTDRPVRLSAVVRAGRIKAVKQNITSTALTLLSSSGWWITEYQHSRKPCPLAVFISTRKSYILFILDWFEFVNIDTGERGRIFTPSRLTCGFAIKNLRFKCKMLEDKVCI